MINKNFYPTPKGVGLQIRKLINWDNVKSVLDPSAGKADLILSVLNLNEISHCGKRDITYYRNDNLYEIYAIEIDPLLRGLLDNVRTTRGYGDSEEKPLKIIGNDFLNYSGGYNFDLIIMNPPFDNGAKHFLKAWNILKNGQMACILNAETLNNPFSKERELLQKIISDNKGEVIQLGSAFKEAERKTNVETILVYIQKETKSELNLDLSGLSFKKENRETIEIKENKFIVPRDEITRLVSECNHKINQYIDLVKGIALYHSNLGDEFSDYKGNYTHKINQYIEKITEEYWNNVINLDKFSKFMTAEVRGQFREKIKSTYLIEFTEENILNFLDMLVFSFDNIMNESILNLFDKMTKYHKENRCHPEGWWTNDSFKVNKKVIVPNIWQSYFTTFKVSWDSESYLNDIDRAMQWLSGQKLENINVYEKEENHHRPKFKGGIVETINNGEFNVQLDSHFFMIRIYKKGTAHLTFKSDDLWKEFNLKAADKKNWLPDDYKMRRDEKIKKRMLIEYK